MNEPAFSMIEKDILDSLDDLGYDYKNEKFDSADSFSKALFNDSASIEFTNAIYWLTKELKLCYKIEESVCKVSDSNDLHSFSLELSSFLKELNCPYTALVDGPISQRLNAKENRLQLLNFLCTELQAGRMALLNNAQANKLPASQSSVQITESETAASLRLMLMSLGFPKPPPNIASQQLFSKVNDKIKELLSKVPKDYLGHPLFVGMLSEKQWQMLAKLNDAMNVEYKGREEMLLKRLDVTVQSFSWSDRVKKQENELHKVYQPIRKGLASSVGRISFGHLLAARTDLLVVDKTSGVSVREKTQSKLNKLLLHGKVPDRGGRPSEIEPPPPEMPPWQKRTGGGGPRGGGGHGNAPQTQRQGVGVLLCNNRGRGGGGRVQGQWSATGGRDAAQSWGNQGAHYANQGDSYQQHGGGYDAGYQQQGGYQQQSYGQNAISPQQQGAAYYQDYYNAGGGGGYQQQQQGGYQQRGGGRGRGRGGGGQHRH